MLGAVLGSVLVATPAAGFGPVRFVPAGDPFLTRTQPGDVYAAARNDVGDAVIVGLPRLGNDGDLFVRTRTGSSQIWSQKVPLTPAGSVRNIAAAMAPDGSAVVVVVGDNGPVAFRRAGRAGTWSGPRLVRPGASGHRAITVVLTDSGRAVLVQATAPSPTCDAKRCRWTIRVIEQAQAGAPWRITGTMKTPKIASLTRTSLASGISDNVAISYRGDVVVAYDEPGMSSVVRVAVKPDEATVFSAPVALSGPGAVNPSAAVADDGGAAVSWIVPDPTAQGVITGRIQVARLPAGSSLWGSAEDLAPLAADPPTQRPAVDAGGAATHVAVEPGGGALVAWSTERLDVTEAASNETTLRAAYRAPGSASWEASPVLADNSAGRFLAVGGAYLHAGRGVITMTNSSDSLAPDFHTSVERDSTLGTWSAPQRLALPPRAIVAAPGGALMGADSDLRVVDEPTAVDAPLAPRVKNFRLKAGLRNAVLRFRLNQPATVWISRSWAPCGGPRVQCIRRELVPGTFHRVDLGDYGRRQAFTVRIAACSPVAGCRFIARSFVRSAVR